MTRNASARRNGFRTTPIRAALIAAALLALTAGCGEFNDDPFNGGFIVRLGFDESAQQSASTGASTTQSITFPEGVNEKVLTLIVGPIVITHEKTPGGGIQPYTSEAEVTDTNRELLEKDAEQSVVYLEIVQLPNPDNAVEFEIPPDSAGRWQLIAVGLRERREALAEILDTDPIWYGFTPDFLDDDVKLGVTQFTLTLEPACSLTTTPDPPCAP